MPCSQHFCQLCSPFGRLTPPTPISWHPSHSPAPIPHSWNTCQALRAHPKIAPSVPGSQHLYPAHSALGRLTVLTPCFLLPRAVSQHPSLSHSTHPSLTAPIPCPQHPSHTCSTHIQLTALMPGSQHPSHTHSTHARLTGPLPAVCHLYHSTCAMLVAPMVASQHPHQFHDTHTSPTIPTQVPYLHISTLALPHSCPCTPLPPQDDCTRKMSPPGAIPTIHVSGTGVMAGALLPHPLCWAGSPFPPIWACARWPQLVQVCHELGELGLPLPWSKGLVIVRGCWGRPRRGHHRESKGPRGHGDKGPIKLIQPGAGIFHPDPSGNWGVLQNPWLWGPWVGGEGPGVPRWGVPGCWSWLGRW